MQRLGVEFARDLETVTNLVTPDRCGGFRVLRSVDFAVIKTALFQFLLGGLNGLVSPRGRADQETESYDKNRSLHRKPSGLDAACLPLFIVGCADARSNCRSSHGVGRRGAGQQHAFSIVSEPPASLRVLFIGNSLTAS